MVTFPLVDFFYCSLGISLGSLDLSVYNIIHNTRQTLERETERERERESKEKGALAGSRSPGMILTIESG